MIAMLKILLAALEWFESEAVVGVDQSKKFVVSQDEMDAIKKVRETVADCLPNI